MNRTERRHFEKEMSKVLKKSDGVCGVCGVKLKHNSQTFGGILESYGVVLTGECCVNELEVIMGAGVYINKNIKGILSVMKTGQGVSHASPSDALSAIRQIRSGIGEIDSAADLLMREAGIETPPTDITVTDAPWKLDDAEWFNRHPGRSYRMRSLHPDEIPTLQDAITDVVIPPNHCWEILVRQVNKGQRIRTAFCRNMAVFIPDADDVIHAIFDIVVQSEGKGVISGKDVAALAASYNRYQYIRL